MSLRETSFLLLACGNGALNGLEPCDGEVFRQGRACAAYGLGDGEVACTPGCTLSFAACAATDYCEANGHYGDGPCDACDLLGGHADPDCAAACGPDGFCADRLDPLTGVWTCQHAGLTDADCGACGDGVLEGNELCDGDVFATGTTCGPWGYGSGRLTCASDCRPDFSGCTLCGNGVRDPGEACDGADLGGWSCSSVGLELTGAVTCTANCRVDTSVCRHRDAVDWSALAGAYCGYIARCAGSTPDGVMVTDEVGCEQYMTESFACGYGVIADAALASQCVAELATLGCGRYALLRGAKACLRLTEGESAGALGAVCQDDLGCDEGLYCGGTGCAVCRPRARTGELCSSAPCLETDYCAPVGPMPVTFPNDTRWVCARLKSDGQDCLSPGECESGRCTRGVCGRGLPLGSACRGSSDCDGLLATCYFGVCTAPGLPGQACSSPAQCQTPSTCVDGRCAYPDRCSAGAPGQPCGDQGCRAGSVCNQSGVCQAELPVGGVCHTPFDCGQTAYCDLATGSSDGRCTAYHPLGSACTSSDECLYPARCDAVMRVCSGPRANGADCSSADECASYDCADGVCVDRWACLAP